jgi:nicotinate-nucleotide adenylyltransferase
MKVGVFGGSFDPFHLGHLNLSIEMLEKRGLDEVWFCPARLNPFKQEGATAAAVHRLEMVRLGTSKFPFFRLLDLELTREGPSYTYDTIVTLMQTHKAQFSLILGNDALAGLSRWHRIEELITLVPLLIGSRKGNLDSITGSPSLLEAIQRGLTPTREMEISATEVRQRLREGLICDHLLPKEVLDYIKRHQLYS